MFSTLYVCILLIRIFSLNLTNVFFRQINYPFLYFAGFLPKKWLFLQGIPTSNKASGGQPDWWLILLPAWLTQGWLTPAWLHRDPNQQTLPNIMCIHQSNLLVHMWLVFVSMCFIIGFISDLQLHDCSSTLLYFHLFILVPSSTCIIYLINSLSPCNISFQPTVFDFQTANFF